MDKQALADITVFNKYAKFSPENNRRENWNEIVDRNAAMHKEKYPHMADQIDAVYNNFVKTKRVLPSMRSLQFGGRPILLNEARIFNCAYSPTESPKFFSELMFLLLGGTGKGYSVQKRHVGKLPKVKQPESDMEYKFQVQDSIVGWSDAIKVVAKAFFNSGTLPVFDYRDIREKGSELVTTGGQAPGHAPLKACVEQLVALLRNAIGRRLRSIEAHDMSCIVADAVLAGGIRRAAMIALFDRDDEEMLTAKATCAVRGFEVVGNAGSQVVIKWENMYGATGESKVSEYDVEIANKTGKLPWYIVHPYRARANNSAVLPRGEVSEAEFSELMKRVEASGCGEPGIYWTNNEDWGTNPCCLSGDMELLTEDGYKPLSSLVDKEFNNVNKLGHKSEGKVWSNGVKDVVKLALSKGKAITCTPDHVFMASDGVGYEAKDFIGKRMMPFYTIKSVPENEEDFKAGFILGDGMLNRLNSESHLGMEVCIGQKDLEVGEYFGVSTAGNHYLTSVYDLAVKYGLKGANTFDRILPEEVSQDFMMGLYSANGSVIKRGKRVALKAASKALIDKVVVWLEANGMTPYVTTNKPTSVEFANGTYVCKQSYDVNLSGLENLTKFAEKVSFVHQYKRDALEQAIKDSGRVVRSAKSAGSVEVFDFSEPEVHWGVIEGVITHNCEIGLRPYQMCNLVEINAGAIDDQQSFNDAASAAAFIATLQAGYTDFHYLNPKWKLACEKDSLLGVSMTGIASGVVERLSMKEAAAHVKTTNERVAKQLGIKKAARTTCVKPAGTTSLVLGTASGIHAWHNDYYIRRMRAGKDEKLAQYMMQAAPGLVEQDVNVPHQVVLSFPQKAPEGATIRTESMLSLLERVKSVATQWVSEGHRSGSNKHNVSCTISVKDGEWEELTKWMWDNKEHYNGISVLPYFGASAYPQLPFEDITEARYNEMLPLLQGIDISKVYEEDGSSVNLSSEIACGGAGCEIV